MKKIRHHYVWRKYLNEWADNENIWCLRNGKTFKANTTKVGLEKNFYNLKKLSSLDIEFIEKEVVQPSNEALKGCNMKWLKIFTLISKLKDLINNNGYFDEEAAILVDEFEHNLEEDFHSLIEIKSINYMNSILDYDINFLDNDSDYINFVFYLSTQYMRTKKLKEVVYQDLQVPNSINIENCWSIMRHVYATNIAWSLFVSRKQIKMILLKNQTSTKFITGDQPVINTYAAFKDRSEEVNQLELYYPISPNIAILVSEKEKYRNLNNINIDEQKVVKLNNMIIDSSYEQIYACSEAELQIGNKIKN